MHILSTSNYESICIQGTNDELYHFGKKIRTLSEEITIFTNTTKNIYYPIVLEGVKLRLTDTPLIDLSISDSLLCITGGRNCLDVLAHNFLIFENSIHSEHYHFDCESDRSWIAPTRHSLILECV